IGTARCAGRGRLDRGHWKHAVLAQAVGDRRITERDRQQIVISHGHLPSGGGRVLPPPDCLCYDLAMAELFTVLAPADALHVLESHLPAEPSTEQVRLTSALDRVLAEDLISPVDLPDFPRSTMDGFAVRAVDTYGASEGMPAYLNIAGEVLMGARADASVGVSDAVRIATGGMMPSGADAVVMVENTQAVDTSTIEVVRPVAPGENVLRVGEDITRGATVLAGGHVLRPQDIGGLAALAITEI